LDAAARFEEGRIEDYADKFRWWPVVKLTISYAF
jgi:hypothetical protein